jgi:ribosome maturation factor RimP
MYNGVGVKKRPAFFVTKSGVEGKNMKKTPLEHKITDIVRPAIEDMGFELVWVEFKSGILQILAENPQTSGIGLDECSAISKAISPLLEVEDPIAGAYTLEISSPGIDRPLIKEDDFNRFKGFEAKIELDEPTKDGQKRFRGTVLGHKQGYVGIVVDGVEHHLELANIRKARLVLTDDLIKATKKNVTKENA